MDYYTRLQSRTPSSSSSFPPHRTQLHPRMHYAPSVPAPKPFSQSRIDHRWWIAAAAVLILPFLFYLFAAARRTHLSSRFGAPSAKLFGVVIDAGRSGSRVHVFEYLNEGKMIPFGGEGAVSMKARQALRAFAGEPQGAGKSLLELLDFARRTVPRAEWGRTKVRMVESGGLEELQPDTRTAVLESCRRVLKSSGFVFRDEWATSITGRERGVYAWVAANYALGTFGSDPEKTTGVVEIGGASAQITFIPKELPPTEFSYVLRLPRINYNLYASSIQQFGLAGMGDILHSMHDSKSITTFSKSPGFLEMAAMSSCFPKGYGRTYNLHAPSSSGDQKLFADSWGNFSACRSKSLELLQEEKGICSQPPCDMLSKFLPKFHGEPLPLGNFLYLSEFFGLGPRASLLEIEDAGRHYCQDDWAKLREEHISVDEADLLRYCFSSAYLIAFLHDGLGIPVEAKSIGFTNRSTNALDWTLGVFILHTVVEPELEPDNLDHIVGDDSLTYIMLFAFLLLVILSIFFVSRWQRPQLKMIYDLEKGHYIVTRMPR